VPANTPLVFHVNVLVVEYVWTICHGPVLERIQNSYRGLGQPDAAPVNVTVVPAVDCDPGALPNVTEPHDKPFNVYADEAAES